ncbi:deoxynucleoside kinase [Clostridium perfringens]|nr:deoxynucleoside kinase [Clostridium perfringens]
MVLVIAGMIGIGKSSVAKILGEHFGSEVFYESVDDNPILPLFYGKDEEEVVANDYPFKLQLYFLNTRFASIKKALVNDNNVLDRSIYEDWYFAKVNKGMGRIDDLEFSLYEGILNNMMEELEELPKKSPDLLIYLKGSFDTILKRINMRGRGYELAPELVDYYKLLWSGYDEWLQNHYTASQTIIIDMDKMDVVHNEDDKETLIKMVEDKLKEVRSE